MKITDILNQNRPTLSFEVFPPKTSDTYDSVAKATQEIAALRPDFMSVTYGAGGGTSEYTVGIAAGIRQQYGVDVLAHLTCASSTREHVARVLEQLKEKGIQNVLALRGTSPRGALPPTTTSTPPSWWPTSAPRGISASAGPATPRDTPSPPPRIPTSTI